MNNIDEIKLKIYAANLMLLDLYPLYNREFKSLEDVNEFFKSLIPENKSTSEEWQIAYDAYLNILEELNVEEELDNIMKNFTGIYNEEYCILKFNQGELTNLILSPTTKMRVETLLQLKCLDGLLKVIHDYKPLI